MQMTDLMDDDISFEADLIGGGPPLKHRANTWTAVPTAIKKTSTEEHARPSSAFKESQI